MASYLLHPALSQSVPNSGVLNLQEKLLKFLVFVHVMFHTRTCVSPICGLKAQEHTCQIIFLCVITVAMLQAAYLHAPLGMDEKGGAVAQR